MTGNSAQPDGQETYSTVMDSGVPSVPAPDAGEEKALAAVASLYAGTLLGPDHRPTQTLFVSGPPRSGKTTFAIHALLAAYGNAPDGSSDGDVAMAEPVMLSSSRLAAQDLNRYAIVRVQVGNNPRIVTTISALAFSILTAGYVSHLRTGFKPPRLLNGAEQDALLDDVLRVHLKHAHDGDLCPTCMLLLRYFEAPDAASAVSDASVARGDGDAASSVTEATGGDASGSTTEDLFIRSFVPAFTAQLRDFLARANEVGADASHEDAIFDRLDDLDIESGMRSRLALQWRLAFALRREYAQRVSERYPDEYRVDASFLLSAAAQEVDDDLQGCIAAIPRVIVIDDAQDITFAGMRLLQTMERRAGARLVFVGNADEAVQVFRGSYPDFLYLRMTSSPDAGFRDGAAGGFIGDDFARLDAATSSLGARSCTAVQTPEGTTAVALDESNATYRDVAVSRVSLGIATDEDNMPPMTGRPGKMPRLDGATDGPASAVSQTGGEAEGSLGRVNGGIAGYLFHSAADEMDAAIRRMSRMHLERNTNDPALGRPVEWNDMAVIAHDNATVRAYGERMQALGIPVRYTSVTHSFAGDPVIEGLLALVDLAQMRRGTYHYVIDPMSDDSPDRQRARQVRRALHAFASSPYADVETGNQLGGVPLRRPLRIDEVQSVLASIQTLAQTALGHPDAVSADIQPLIEVWGAADAQGSMHDLDELCALLVCGVPQASRPQASETSGHGRFAVAHGILAAMTSIGTSPDVTRFCSLFDFIDPVCTALAEPDATVDTVLWAAWDACAVSDEWSKLALLGSVESHRANDSLDTAMRLFRFAHDGDFHSFAEFASQVRTMDVEADSLAKTGPVVDAVTLTTPAGAAGRSWPYVWIPAVQQGVWPNPTVRNTMFGGEDLTDIMIRGSIRSTGPGDGNAHDARVSSVLHSEEKSFLVALTRGSEFVTVSCVWDADHIPSVFLTEYLHELFPVSDDPGKARFQTARTVESHASHPSEVVAEARRVLTCAAIDALGQNADVMVGDAENFDVLAAVESPDCPPSFRRAASMFTTMGLRQLTSIGAFTSYRDALKKLAAGDGTMAESAKDRPQVADAIRALHYLADEGYDDADPRHWPFVYADGDTSALIGSPEERASLAQGDEGDGNGGAWTVTDEIKARRAAKMSGAEVHLSPSSVDALWQCPICALLDNGMSGPDAPTPAAAFGSIVHKVAQIAAEKGWDNPGTVFPELASDASPQGRKEAIARRLREVYDGLSTSAAADAGVADRYDLKQRERKVDGILAHMANYFVDENATTVSVDGTARPSYGEIGENNYARIGSFDSVEAERQFSSSFTIDDITQAYNATPGVQVKFDRSEMLKVMDILCGGFPDDFDPDTRIHLSARVDRLEKRVDAAGEFYRIIDYKTGSPHTMEEIMNDLQLVCYQLAMRFSPEFHGKPPVVSGADLFYVRDKATPGESYQIPELYMQPPLFDGAVLNSHIIGRRKHDTTKALQMVDESFETRLKGMPEDFQNKVRALCMGPGSTLWALAMISRVFYAAAVMQAEKIPVRAPRPGHNPRFCDYRRLCPACAHVGGYPMDTVMGRSEER